MLITLIGNDENCDKNCLLLRYVPPPPQFLTTPLMRNYQHVREIQHCRRWQILLAVNMILMATLVMLESVNTKEPYHTSILTGEGWVQELLNGHPERIRCEIGIHLHVFTELVSQLRSIGHTNLRNISLEEQVAIFLYTSVTGLTIRHVGEWFQWSNETVSRWVQVPKARINVFIMVIAIFEKFFPFFLWVPSTAHMCACQQQIIPFHLKFATIRSSGLSSRIVSALWMAVISIVHLLHISD
jgi:hypothetical protein